MEVFYHMEQITFESLFNEMSLYKEMSLDDENIKNLLLTLLLEESLKADLYCVECKKDRIFNLIRNDLKPKFYTAFYRKEEVYQEENKFKKDPIKYKVENSSQQSNTLELSCSDNPAHIYSLTMNIVGNRLIKTGQYPSIANLEKHDIDKYKKLLKSDYSNLNRAIGLHSHGVGAGSYVYLRRIFENLIEEKHKECLQESDWDNDTYSRSRMADKIKMLEHKLPKLFKEAPALYGVLSKGVHELSEDECREYFPVLKYAIELILDEKLAELEENTKKDNLLKSIAGIATKIN